MWGRGEAGRLLTGCPHAGCRWRPKRKPRRQHCLLRTARSPAPLPFIPHRDIPDSVFRNDGLWRQWYDDEAPEMAKVGRGGGEGARRPWMGQQGNACVRASGRSCLFVERACLLADVEGLNR